MFLNLVHIYDNHDTGNEYLLRYINNINNIIHFQGLITRYDFQAIYNNIKWHIFIGGQLISVTTIVTKDYR
jgi:hypothetical protein